MAEQSFKAGEVVFRRGDPSERAYLLESGEVEILREDESGAVRLALLRPGQIFGEMGLVDERPRSLTARAVSPARVTTISREEFVELVLHKPEESLRYIRHLFERLREMNRRAVLGEEPGPTASLESVRVRIVPLTARAEEGLPDGGLELPQLPYRIGRASDGAGLEVNDLELHDLPPYNVSRNHVAIDREGDRIVVRDRGSFLGTMVNGTAIGGRHQGAEAALQPGDNELILGSHHSPFRYRVVVEPATR